jgi:hypothetical protein
VHVVACAALPSYYFVTSVKNMLLSSHQKKFVEK